MSVQEDHYKIVKKRILKQIDSEEYKKAYARTEQGKVDRNHFLEVVRIVEDIWQNNEKTTVPIALKIAALCHDSDRVYPKLQVNTKDYPEGQYTYRKGIHSGNTALIFFEKNLDVPKTLLHDVCYLILRHEGGGDKNCKQQLFEKQDEYTKSYNLNLAADYLWYADKLSFFYSNITEYAKRGEEKLREKVIFSLQSLPKSICKNIQNIPFSSLIIQKIVDEELKKIFSK